MKIVQMPDALANKIAAGEVVERPASVVKELVENSIDANSTWVKVEIEEAGLQSIKISDNGEGMAEDDCERAFFRHATSKIKDENDLFHVRTLGFRGEALASIAAVSRLSIKTSTGDAAGTSLEMEGGKFISKSKSDARRGTEITVNELFFNTPARLKYMKTIHTELGHITDLMNRLAFSHPNIHFELSHNGKQLFQTSGRGDLVQIIAQVYGFQVAKQMIPVSYKTLDFSISGYIAKPEVTRSSRNYISTIINGRFIKSIPLSKSISQGYHTLLPIGRNPLVVLTIEMDPILVDVNVHPAKLEVRFSKDKELYQAVETMIREAFQKQTLIPSGTKPKHQKLESVQDSFELYPAKQERTNDQRLLEKTVTETMTSPSFNAYTIPAFENHQAEGKEKLNQTDDGQAFHEKVEEQLPTASPAQPEQSDTRVPAMYPIGQLHGTYIMAQNENGLYIIDQHAAQERIKYEFFKEKIGEVANEVQELLLPITFDFSKQEALMIEQYQTELEKIGIFFEAFGQQSYVIRSHPQWFPDGFEEEVIQEIVDTIMADEKINVHKLREDAAILMSCKRSIKANHYLNNDDMFQLLEDLRAASEPFTCPHGRPIIIHFSTYEMEKMFKRVM
ncbi:DNA mismatch repair endonuclease MutL [Radiobacillus sp. PE A8.2]|uniref:DNA mismatch repair endonuclease MutL n=1 Tax=Radiobacillus sp. PE A8.2 TaxID=3380349 RepID=UPI00388E2545